MSPFAHIIAAMQATRKDSMTQLMAALLGLFYASLIWAAPVPFVTAPGPHATQGRLEPLLSSGREHTLLIF
ncbi:hypothetical protein DN613_21925 [Aeromonas caviae]|nr:hypothetical protein DN613_21925 [Aeromonas caviae]